VTAQHQRSVGRRLWIATWTIINIAVMALAVAAVVSREGVLIALGTVARESPRAIRPRTARLSFARLSLAYSETVKSLLLVGEAEYRRQDGGLRQNSWVDRRLRDIRTRPRHFSTQGVLFPGQPVPRIVIGRRNSRARHTDPYVRGRHFRSTRSAASER
jgi:hypothetical protein